LSLSAVGRNSWLAFHSLLAIALTVGFYVLAIAMAAFLLVIPVAMVAYGNVFNLWVAIGCVVGAGGILRSMVPPRLPWVDPGPVLLREAHPRLFALLGEVAAATREKMPEVVYVDLRVNAAVLERRRFLWFGRRRVMILGYPLLAAWSGRELSGCLAHEFGHFRSGSLILNAPILRTRLALERTLARLGRNLAHLPILWYGRIYLRLTRAIARQQERIADAVEIETFGSEVFASETKKFPAATIAFAMFWRTEFAPAVESGFLPPLAAGFRSYLLDPRVRRSMDSAVTQELGSSRGGPYDTHPTAAERLRSARMGVGPAVDFAAPPAVDLLGDLPAVELSLLRHVIGKDKAQALQPVAWDEAVTRLTLPRWKKMVSLGTLALQGRVVRDLPDLVRPLGSDPFVSANNVDRGRAVTFAAALGNALHRDGWTILATGATLRLEGRGTAIDPFAEIADLASGSAPHDEWRERVARLGIDALPLDDRASPAAPAGAPHVLESATLQTPEPA
jgi:Zn-dependent protease with chaperone function